MPAGGRSANTMAEALHAILAEISVAKTYPDADLEFLVNLETTILAEIRKPMEQAAGQIPGGAPSGPPAGPGGPGGGGQAPPMMMGPPPGTGGPPGPPGLRAQPSMPSPDELQRMMAGSA